MQGKKENQKINQKLEYLKVMRNDDLENYLDKYDVSNMSQECENKLDEDNLSVGDYFISNYFNYQPGHWCTKIAKITRRTEKTLFFKMFDFDDNNKIIDKYLFKYYLVDTETDFNLNPIEHKMFIKDMPKKFGRTKIINNNCIYKQR